jgi:hypothetical protein
MKPTRNKTAKPIRKTYRKKDYAEAVRRLYPRIRRDQANHTGEYPGHKITYGELEYAGIDHLWGHLDRPFDAFLEVGSGRGKLVFYMAAKPPIRRSVGIELVRERHQDAAAMLKRLPQAMQKKVVLRQGDVAGMDIEALFPGCRTVFVWFSNLCFEESATDRIFDKLCRELPAGSVIALSKEPTTVKKKAKKLGDVHAAMSWNASSQVHLYEVI